MACRCIIGLIVLILIMTVVLIVKYARKWYFIVYDRKKASYQRNKTSSSVWKLPACWPGTHRFPILTLAIGHSKSGGPKLVGLQSDHQNWSIQQQHWEDSCRSYQVARYPADPTQKQPNSGVDSNNFPALKFEKSGPSQKQTEVDPKRNWAGKGISRVNPHGQLTNISS